MKRTLLSITIGLALCASAFAQTNPPVSGGNILIDLGSITNWEVQAYGIADLTTHKGGAGVGALYNVTANVGTVARFDYINNSIWRVSGTAQLQAPVPFKIAGTTLVFKPFGFTGAATAVGGTGTANGNAILISGVGAELSVYKSVSVIADHEWWGSSRQIRLGATYKF